MMRRVIFQRRCFSTGVSPKKLLVISSLNFYDSHKIIKDFDGDMSVLTLHIRSIENMNPDLKMQIDNFINTDSKFLFLDIKGFPTKKALDNLNGFLDKKSLIKKTVIVGRDIDKSLSCLFEKTLTPESNVNMIFK